MITFHNVNKRYRTPSGYKVVLDDASLYLPERNIAVLGGNGAGKSTLLRMISGAEEPTSGVIECNRKVSFPLGFAGSFNGTLSGIENTLFVSRIYAQDTDAVVAYVKEFSQLDEHLYMPVNTYSSGMRARLAFGVSLAIDFDIYLVDEITAVGDARFKARSKAAFKERLAHASMIMVSHSMGTLRDYCDAGVVLRDGQMRYFEDLEEAIEDHNAYMGVPARQNKGGRAGRPDSGAGRGAGKGWRKKRGAGQGQGARQGQGAGQGAGRGAAQGAGPGQSAGQGAGQGRRRKQGARQGQGAGQRQGARQGQGAARWAPDQVSQGAQGQPRQDQTPAEAQAPMPEQMPRQAPPRPNAARRSDQHSAAPDAGPDAELTARPGPPPLPRR